ncbi:MAG: hypothetical protein K6E42_06580 [Synergistes sp.]|nr:hypothetical protein [Synergistes sp.]
MTELAPGCVKGFACAEIHVLHKAAYGREYKLNAANDNKNAKPGICLAKQYLTKQKKEKYAV